MSATGRSEMRNRAYASCSDERERRML